MRQVIDKLTDHIVSQSAEGNAKSWFVQNTRDSLSKSSKSPRKLLVI